MWLIDGFLLTLNVIAFTLPLFLAGATVQAIAPDRRRASAARQALAWLAAACVVAGMVAGYVLAYRAIGFPNWMRWLVG